MFSSCPTTFCQANFLRSPVAKKSQEIPFLPHITRWDRTHYVLVGPDCSWPLSCAVHEKPGGLCTPPSPNTAHLFGNCIFQRAALEHFQPWVSQDGLPVLSYCSCAASAPWVPWLIVGLAQLGFQDCAFLFPMQTCCDSRSQSIHPPLPCCSTHKKRKILLFSF